MNEKKKKNKDYSNNKKDISKEEKSKLSGLLLKVGFLILFALATLIFLVIYIKKNFELPEEALILPRSLEDAKILSNIFTKYTNENRNKLIFVYSYIYIWKSSFGLPGSIVMVKTYI